MATVKLCSRRAAPTRRAPQLPPALAPSRGRQAQPTLAPSRGGQARQHQHQHQRVVCSPRADAVPQRLVGEEEDEDVEDEDDDEDAEDEDEDDDAEDVHAEDEVELDADGCCDDDIEATLECDAEWLDEPAH